MKSTKQIYSNRFNDEKINLRRNNIWKILCKQVFQKTVSKNDTLIDIGAGYCEFINNISCKVKIAVDINPDIRKKADVDVQTQNINIFSIPKSLDGKIDVVFMSNVLEHLNSKAEVITILEKSYSLLKNRGKIILMHPDIDLIRERYWDFIDHTVPLNLKSLVEALEITGFKINSKTKRFLPYTTISRFITLPGFLLKLYLLFPPFLRPFAGQNLIIADKP